MNPLKNDLISLSKLLISLHKELIDIQFVHYEKVNGRIKQSGTKLDLLLNHKDFQWLRPLSALIANIDDQIAQKKLDTVVAKDLFKQVEVLIFSDRDQTFSKKYQPFDANHPRIILLHQELKKAITQISSRNLDS